MRNALSETSATFQLTACFSPCRRQSLSLVPALLCTAAAQRTLINVPLWPRPDIPYLYRDRVILWLVRLAGPLLALRVAVGRRKCAAEHGLGVRNGRRQQLHQCRQRAIRSGPEHRRQQYDSGGIRRRAESTEGKKRDKRRHGKGHDQWRSGLGRGDGRGYGLLAWREGEAILDGTTSPHLESIRRLETGHGLPYISFNTTISRLMSFLCGRISCQALHWCASTSTQGYLFLVLVCLPWLQEGAMIMQQFECKPFL